MKTIPIKLLQTTKLRPVVTSLSSLTIFVLFFFMVKQTAVAAENIPASFMPLLLGGEKPVTPSDSFSFMVFGDLNGGGCARNARVANIVNHMTQQSGVAFYISTGDLIDGYEQSDGSAVCFGSDPSTPPNNYTECTPGGNIASILSPIKDRTPVTGLEASFYPVIGNHDDNWGSGWYPDPCGDGICDFLAPLTPDDYINHPHGDICSIDNSTSTHSMDFYYSFTYKNSYFIILRINNDYSTMLSSCNTHPGHPDCISYCSDPALFDNPQRNDSCWGDNGQYEWFLNELQQAKNYEHIFVFSHGVALGSGENHLPYAGAEKIREVAEENNVDIYFNGHNHAYERTHPIRGSNIDTRGTVYITAGTAGAPNDYNQQDWFTAATYRKWIPGSTTENTMATYMKITVDGSQIQGEVFNPVTQNDPVDQFSLPAANSDIPQIGGCQLFPANNIWNTPVESLPIHPLSDAYIDSIGRTTSLHPDFGSEWNGIDLGIPFDLVPENQPVVPITFRWADESDLGETGACSTGGNSSTGCYPIPPSPSIEGGSDHHVLLLQQGTCMLYEIYDAENDGGWSGGSGAIWDTAANQVRPLNYTSADASGLAILPGLIRYDEVVGANEIHHVMRITMSNIQAGYIWPATHSDGTGGSNPDLPPMGLQLRLKAGYDISSFSPNLQKIMRALKKYGIIIADTGSSMYISGQHHDNWNDSDLHILETLTADNFEVVDTGKPVIPYPCSGAQCPEEWPLSY